MLNHLRRVNSFAIFLPSSLRWILLRRTVFLVWLRLRQTSDNCSVIYFSKRLRVFFARLALHPFSLREIPSYKRHKFRYRKKAPRGVLFNYAFASSFGSSASSSSTMSDSSASIAESLSLNSSIDGGAIYISNASGNIFLIFLNYYCIYSPSVI